MIIKKIIYHLRNAANDAAFSVGLRRAEHLFSRCSGQRILTYHGIDRAGRLDLNARFISAKKFEEHIRYLSEYTNIITLDDYFHQRFDEQTYNIAITFDDGYRNNLEYGLPILEKYHVPATIFVTPVALCGTDALWMDILDIVSVYGPDSLTIQGEIYYRKKWRHTNYYIDSDGNKLVHKAQKQLAHFAAAMMLELRQYLSPAQWEAMSDYWHLLDANMLRQMAAAPLVSIGAHGLTHQDLALAPESEVLEELKQSKTLLETCIGRPVFQLAYPFGTYRRSVVDLARTVGYTQQYALDFLFDDDHSDTDMRARFGINPYLSTNNQWLALRRGKY
jgi:peptidoglycan/xylan/chitin deacetylase (PgdA/CDA1 family)